MDIEVLKAQVKESANAPEACGTCEILPQKHSNYKSCKVIIKGMPKEGIAGLYEPEKWDENLIVRRWFH